MCYEQFINEFTSLFWVIKANLYTTIIIKTKSYSLHKTEKRCKKTTSSGYLK